ncbi:hypothetical protein B0T21DRAFT_297507 [Apiosordaria backusii]|uniref:SUN domain-containing protein n=1 Tax=Apiosordaria backusii TaxID=314023 RepID=A0AA40AAB5_9PEZI|nr:hypothetical protein B0T21DRAFT_297507 [Apiosordaria backusii]
MTDALSSPTTSLHISLNLSQSPISRETSPYQSLNHNNHPATLFTMPPRQRPARGGIAPTPSPQQQGRAGTPSSVRSTRKQVDAGSVRVDIPVKYSTSYGSAMATFPDRVRVMGGGNVRTAVHGVLDQVTKDNEAAKARRQAKEQERASRTKTSSPQPQQAVQPPPPVQQPQTVGGRTRAPGKTTLSQQISRSESEESEEQEEGEDEDGPSQKTLVESQHGATTSTRGGLLSGQRSKSHSASAPGSTRSSHPSNQPANPVVQPAKASQIAARKRSRGSDSSDSAVDSDEEFETQSRKEAMRKLMEANRKENEETAAQRAAAAEQNRREAQQAAQAWQQRDQAEQALPPASNSLPRPPSVSVSRPPAHQSVPTRPLPRPPVASATVGAPGNTGDGNPRSWQEENGVYSPPGFDGAASSSRGLFQPVSSPAVGNIVGRPPRPSLEAALGTIGQPSRPSVGGIGGAGTASAVVGGMALEDVPGALADSGCGPLSPRYWGRGGNVGGGGIGGIGGIGGPPNKPPVPGRRNPGSSDSSSGDEDNEGPNPHSGPRYTGRPNNQRIGREGANRNAGAARMARARKTLGKIWWPTLQWVLTASLLIGTLSVLLGPNGPSVPSFPSFSSGSFSGPMAVFTEEQYDDFKRFWESRSTATEAALQNVQSTLPKLVRVTKDKHGNIIVAKEFWEAILDRVKHEPSILKLDKGKISEDHWDAIRARIKSAGLDQSVEDWFVKNKDRISGIFSGHPITKPVTSRKETYEETVTRDQYLENLRQQVSKSRQDFEKELAALRKELHGLIEEQRHKTGGLTKKEIQKVVKDIVDKELGSSVFRPGKQSPVAAINDMLSRHVNWFSFGNGAQIDLSVTSPTFRLDRPSMGTVAWLRTMAKKPQFLHDSFHATSLWTDSGHCWCAGIFAGKNKEKLPADIGISVAGLIIPKYVAVENINPGATTDPGSMPKDIEVWAKFENKAKNKQMKKWMNTQFPTAAENPRNAGQLREDFVQIGKFTYEYRLVDNGVFIHKLSEDLVALDAVVETVLIRAVTNNGSPDHTCFYRLRLYGQEIDEETGRHIGSSSW